MSSVRYLGSTLVLLLVLSLGSGVSVKEEKEPSSTTTSTSIVTTKASSEATAGKTVDKIARRIIDERLSPPTRQTEFSLWNKRLPALGEIQHRLNISPPRVTEELDDNVTEKATPKKTRTVGPTAGTQDPNCCGGEPNKSLGPNDKDKSSQQQQQESDEPDVERGGANGPAPRYHGNRPYDDRYGSSGWKSSSYLGYNKDKNYYDQRNHYAYDRYGSAQRPGSYAVDGDRYNGGQRPSSSSNTGSSSSSSASSSTNSDRYGTASSGDRFGTSRPSGNYQAVGGGYGAYAGGPYNRPSRPGYGISGSLDEADGEYPFEGDAPGPVGPNIANLQTQKAVALKALAGVALIGAAAALASNPVLLPISVLTGRRRRRSAEIESDNFALTALLQGYIQPKPGTEVGPGVELAKSKNTSSSSSQDVSSGASSSQELVISPQCVARLACHVHRDYLDELDKSRAELERQTGAEAARTASADVGGLEHWFDSLIHSNILAADYLSSELKSLIQSAVIVGSNRNETCDQFSCLNAQNSQKNKKNN